MRFASLTIAAVFASALFVSTAVAGKPINPGKSGNSGENNGHGNANANANANGNGNRGGNGNGGGPQQTPLTTCSAGNLSIAAIQCSGFVGGNVLSNSGAGLDAQAAALTALGLSWDRGFSTLLKFDGSGSKTLDFGEALYGETIFGIHFGAANGGTSVGGNGGTAFYKFDAGTTGITSIYTIFDGSSGVVLYKTGLAPAPEDESGTGPTDGAGAVPEPASWAMMLIGFGGLGTMLRRRSKVALTFA
jgi:hypothetical protein